jgi:hypothetical protein
MFRWIKPEFTIRTFVLSPVHGTCPTTGSFLSSESGFLTWNATWAPVILFQRRFLRHLTTSIMSILIIVQRDATQSSVFVIPQIQSTCFGCQSHPSSGIHKTVTTACNVAKFDLATLEGGSCTKNITNTGGCSYSFVHSWEWVWLTPETIGWACRVINRLLCVASRWTIINIDQRCTEP